MNGHDQDAAVADERVRRDPGEVESHLEEVRRVLEELDGQIAYYHYFVFQEALDPDLRDRFGLANSWPSVWHADGR